MKRKKNRRPCSGNNMPQGFKEAFMQAMKCFMHINRLERFLAYRGGNGYTVEITPPKNYKELKMNDDISEGYLLYMLIHNTDRILFTLDGNNLTMAEIGHNSNQLEIPVNVTMPFNVLSTEYLNKKAPCKSAKIAKSLI